jgi:hypothetical protein
MNRIDDLNNPAILLRRLHHWRMAFFGLIILLAGIGIGAGTMLILRPVAPGPDDQTISIDRVARTLRYRLDLSDEQGKDIRPVLYDCLRELNKIRQEARPAISEELEHMSEGIASVLNDAQLQEWKRMQRKLVDQFHGNRIYRTIPAKTPPKTQRSARQQRQASPTPKTGTRPRGNRESDTKVSTPKKTPSETKSSDAEK